MYFTVRVSVFFPKQEENTAEVVLKKYVPSLSVSPNALHRSLFILDNLGDAYDTTAELNTALGILANNGIKGAEGGTHLRNVILSLQNPTDGAAKTMEKLGVKTYDSEGNMRSLNDILGDLNKSMDGMTSAEKENIIATIFNKTDLPRSESTSF